MQRNETKLISGLSMKTPLAHLSQAKLQIDLCRNKSCIKKKLDKKRTWNCKQSSRRHTKGKKTQFGDNRRGRVHSRLPTPNTHSNSKLAHIACSNNSNLTKPAHLTRSKTASINSQGSLLFKTWGLFLLGFSQKSLFLLLFNKQSSSNQCQCSNSNIPRQPRLANCPL